LTPIRTAVVTNATSQRRNLTAAILLGASIGFSAAITCLQYVQPAIASNEAAMFAACKLPDAEGAITFWQMRNGLLECGRYK